jgi:hypothetical protein
MSSVNLVQPVQNGWRSVTRSKRGSSGSGWRLMTVTSASCAVNESAR